MKTVTARTIKLARTVKFLGREECKSQTMSKPSPKSDLYQSLTPVFHLNKAFGLLPIRFTLQSTGRYVGRVNLFDLIFSACLLIFFIVAEIFGLWRDLRDGWENSTRLKHQTAVNVTIGDVVAVALLAAVGVLGAPFRWKYLQEMMATFFQADERLGFISLKKTRRFTVVFSALSLMYIAFISSLDIYSWDLQTKLKRKLPDKGPINYSPIYFLYLQALFLEIQFTISAYNLNERFLRLNKNLEQLLRRERGFGDMEKFPVQSEIDMRLPGRVFRAPKITDWAANERDSRSMADAISQLTTVHASLCDTNMLINKAFGLPILVVTITCLMHLIITPYFLIMEANTDREAIFIIDQCLWCVLHVYRILIVVQPSYAATKSSQTTAILVSRLLVYNRDPEVEKQLEIFSLQILHRPLDFSACGLFSLDRTLVTSMAGAVTTYLVILIQFQRADDTKDTNNILKNATLLLRNVSSYHNTTGIKIPS